MKRITILMLSLLILSCGEQTSDKAQVTTETVDPSEAEHTEQQPALQKVTIDFEQHKDILDIILLLPDTSFSTWEWKSHDRISWYNEIKEHGYYTDDDPNYFNQEYFEPTRAGYTIVDGSWSIHIYRTAENSFIVITDDVVGDGNTLNFYEVVSNKIIEHTDSKKLFSGFRELLKHGNTTGNCDETYELLNDPMFEYDFSKENKIDIDGSWYFSEEEHINCLTGNTITYAFNPQEKKFHVERIYWKPKQNN